MIVVEYMTALNMALKMSTEIAARERRTIEAQKDFICNLEAKSFYVDDPEISGQEISGQGSAGNVQLRALPSAEPEQIIKIGQRSGKTLESAINYLQSTGWLQEHDRILTQSVEPERKKGEWLDGLPYVNSHWWVCSICHVPAPENHTGYNFCPKCGADMRGE